MPYELQVAIRYLVARRRQAFVSLISFVSALGVAVGVTALVVALALMTGLQGELRDRMLGSMPHVYVAKIADGGVADPAGERAMLLKLPHVVGAAPVVIGPALVRAGERSAFVTLKGVDPAIEGERHRAAAPDDRRPLRGAGGAARRRAAPGLRWTASRSARTWRRRWRCVPATSSRVLTPEGTLTPMGVMPRRAIAARRRHLLARALRVRLGLRGRVAAGRRCG